MAKHLSPGHPDGTQALRNANQELALATERYEKALREFIDYRPPARGAASLARSRAGGIDAPSAQAHNEAGNWRCSIEPDNQGGG
jgi:hypothetical protein